MDKSKIISVRLSNAELETIQKFQKKYKIKSMNDFFRASSSILILSLDSLAKLRSSKELNSIVDNFQKDFKDELEKVPETKAKLKGKYEFMENSILPKFEQEIDKGIEQLAPFTQERSAGRPPNPKAEPGRPKEQEYRK